MGDETYLETFIEHIATLPHELKRNLELMKDLDRSSASLSEELRQAEMEYLVRAEAKMMELEMAPTPDGGIGVRVLGGGGGGGGTTSSGNNHDNKNNSNSNKNNNNDDDNNADDDNTNKVDGRPVVIPTTEELSEYIQSEIVGGDRNGSMDGRKRMRRIRSLRSAALQQADEKVEIANQTYALVDAAVQRLDRDLAQLEALLKSTGDFETAGGAKPNDLAAIQVTPGVSEWILAKVIQHDPDTGIYKLSDEDIESNKIFHLPESQVIVLGSMDRLSKGDVVFAVYPDTTSFYQATIVQAPRKNASGGSGSNPHLVSGANAAAASGTVVGSGSNGGSFVLVNFVDDSDEHGITHDKAVLLKHVMRPPYGAILQ